MSILSDEDILELISCEKLKIENFSVESLTPNGYDLRISEINIPTKSQMDYERQFIVPQGTMFYVSTLEAVHLPNDICAQLWLRTTWIRKGIIAAFGKVDAGFHGTLTFTCFNASSNSIEIPQGSRFAQIVFERMTKPAMMSYERRSGHYQGQRGITLQPVKKPDVQ
ncbi:MAG: dCTP deaminase [Methanomassiliicoccales archaeon]